MEWRQLWFLLTLNLCTAHETTNDPFPLHTAAIDGDLNLVIHLLQGGADINQQNVGWFYTALHYAAYYGRVEVVRHLLAKGASKTIGDHEGNTAYELSTWNECDNTNLNNRCKYASWDYIETRRLLLSTAVCSPICHNGECTSSNRCNCNQGWTGSLCQNSMCSPRCKNGECVGPNRCDCNPGWTGSLCQTPLCSPRCKNGECVGPSRCDCNPGWTGSLCQTPVCSPRCKNGECVGPNRCDCKPGWTSSLCQTPVCSPICKNGECVGPNRCDCNPGWTGSTCQTQPTTRLSCTSDMNCQRHQMCDGGDCIDVCSTNTCKKNEVCSVEFYSGSTTSICKCPDGFFIDTDKNCKQSVIQREQDIKCAIPSETDSNITILKCGTGEISNCVNNYKVPVETDVLVSCWRSPPIIVRCTNKVPVGASWDICDSSNSCEMPLTRLVHLCQREAPNAQYCGYRPPYYHSSSGVIQQSTAKEWPWLVGIFVREKYVCTGTFISVRYVLSAAHCTAQSKSSKEPIDKLDVKLQYFTGNGIKKSRIDKIIHHPQFKNGARPENDISLLRLPNAVSFSKGLMPACIAKQVPLQTESAVAFNRNENIIKFEWQTVIRKLDNRCQTRRSGNSCQLEIKDRQFCSAPLSIFPGQSSVIEQGSSGGPYLVNTGTEEHEKQSVVGVASYRVEKCGDPFTVYTDITAFSTWIKYCLDTALNATKDCHDYSGF